MNNKSRIAVVAIASIVLIASIVYFISRTNQDLGYFKHQELPTTNQVVNESFDKYYDSVLLVGLDAIGMSGQRVQVLVLSDQTKDNFGGELKANLIYQDGTFYIFTIDYASRREAIRVLAHEIVHMNQYLTGQLSVDYANMRVNWKGSSYPIEMEYNDRPWERDAFSRESTIEDILLTKLYE